MWELLPSATSTDGMFQTRLPCLPHARNAKALYRSASALFHMGIPSRLPEALLLLQRAEALEHSREVREVGLLPMHGGA